MFTETLGPRHQTSNRESWPELQVHFRCFKRRKLTWALDTWYRKFRHHKTVSSRRNCSGLRFQQSKSKVTWTQGEKNAQLRKARDFSPKFRFFNPTLRWEAPKSQIAFNPLPLQAVNQGKAPITKQTPRISGFPPNHKGSRMDNPQLPWVKLALSSKHLEISLVLPNLPLSWRWWCKPYKLSWAIHTNLNSTDDAYLAR